MSHALVGERKEGEEEPAVIYYWSIIPTHQNSAGPRYVIESLFVPETDTSPREKINGRMVLPKLTPFFDGAPFADWAGCSHVLDRLRESKPTKEREDASDTPKDDFFTFDRLLSVLLERSPIVKGHDASQILLALGALTGPPLTDDFLQKTRPPGEALLRLLEIFNVLSLTASMETVLSIKDELINNTTNSCDFQTTGYYLCNYTPAVSGVEPKKIAMLHWQIGDAMWDRAVNPRTGSRIAKQEDFFYASAMVHYVEACHQVSSSGGETSTPPAALLANVLVSTAITLDLSSKCAGSIPLGIPSDLESFVTLPYCNLDQHLGEYPDDLNLQAAAALCRSKLGAAPKEKGQEAPKPIPASMPSSPNQEINPARVHVNAGAESSDGMHPNREVPQPCFVKQLTIHDEDANISSLRRPGGSKSSTGSHQQHPGLWSVGGRLFQYMTLRSVGAFRQTCNAATRAFNERGGEHCWKGLVGVVETTTTTEGRCRSFFPLNPKHFSGACTPKTLKQRCRLDDMYVPYDSWPPHMVDDWFLAMKSIRFQDWPQVAGLVGMDCLPRSQSAVALVARVDASWKSYLMCGVEGLDADDYDANDPAWFHPGFQKILRRRLEDPKAKILLEAVATSSRPPPQALSESKETKKDANEKNVATSILASHRWIKKCKCLNKEEHNKKAGACQTECLDRSTVQAFSDFCANSKLMFPSSAEEETPLVFSIRDVQHMWKVWNLLLPRHRWWEPKSSEGCYPAMRRSADAIMIIVETHLPKALKLAVNTADDSDSSGNDSPTAPWLLLGLLEGLWQVTRAWTVLPEVRRDFFQLAQWERVVSLVVDVLRKLPLEDRYYRCIELASLFLTCACVGRTSFEKPWDATAKLLKLSEVMEWVRVVFQTHFSHQHQPSGGVEAPPGGGSLHHILQCAIHLCNAYCCIFPCVRQKCPFFVTTRAVVESLMWTAHIMKGRVISEYCDYSVADWVVAVCTALTSYGEPSVGGYILDVAADILTNPASVAKENAVITQMDSVGGGVGGKKIRSPESIAIAIQATARVAKVMEFVQRAGAYDKGTMGTIMRGPGAAGGNGPSEDQHCVFEKRDAFVANPWKKIPAELKKFISTEAV